jgi:hypothetical protein
MTHAPAAAYHKAFAAARLLREIAREAHGNLAAVGVAPLAPDDASLAAAFGEIGEELIAISQRLAELRDRTGAIAESHIAANAGALKANFGYAISIAGHVTKATTPVG